MDVLKTPAEKTTEKRAEIILVALQRYEIGFGAYPPSLDMLIKDPGDKNWRGPYLRPDASEWKDGWSVPFQYQMKGEPPIPFLLSAGPDKIFGTGDDHPFK